MKIGLVFAGGGGKGSYQIGVWKAMEEFGYKAEIVAGTSVGALNAALYTQGDLQIGINLWENISTQDVLSFEGENKLTDFINRKLSVNPEHLISILKQKGLFSQSGLKRMISNNIDFNKIKNSSIKFYAAAHNKVKGEIKYFHVNENDDKTITKILLASSSLPIVFDDIEIEGEIYADGGGSILGAISNQLLEKKFAFDNNPIRPLYNENLDFIIWVALDKGTILNYSLFPNTKILPIIPRQNLGNFIKGTLDFSAEGAMKRIEQGYEDASAIFRNIDNLLYDEEKYKKLWDGIKDQEENLSLSFEKIDDSQEEQATIKQYIHKFNQNILDANFTEDDDVVLIKTRSNPMLEGDRALLNSIDRREVQSFVEDFVEMNKDNTKEFQDNVIEALGYITPVKAISEDLKESGFLKSFFDKFTNKTEKAAFTNDQNLALAQEATMQLMGAINKKNLCTLEFVAALNNKMSRAYYEISELHRNMNLQSLQVYETLSLMFQKIKSKIMENSERLEEHENRLLKLEWLATISVTTYCGVEYRNLSDPEKMVCLINDFFRITEGKWNEKELLILKQAMLNIDLYDKRISLQQFKEQLSINKTMRCKLSQGLIEGEGELYIDQYKNEVTAQLQIPAFNFALETLYMLKICGYRPVKVEDLEGSKKAYIDKVDRLKSICKENNLSDTFIKEIEIIESIVKKFKIKVPLIGIFSCGKSTLLNKYMQLELLSYEITPETALATELNYTEENEKTLVYHVDGKIEAYPLDKMDYITEISDDILYSEVYIRSSVLKQHKDIVLVDMPGIDSNYKHHNKAIANYINKGCFYVICLSATEGVPASLFSFLQEMNIYNDGNLSFLVTKIDKIAPSELQSQMNYIGNQLEAIGFKNPIIEKIAAADGEMEGFKRIIENITNRKDEIFIKEMAPSMSSLVGRVDYSLRVILNESDYNGSELEDKKRELETKILDLQSKIKSEKKKAQNKIHNIAQGIANDVYHVLMQMKYTLISEIKAGVSIEDRVRGILQNTYQVSIKQRTQQLFKEAADAVNRYVSESVFTEASVNDLALFDGINIDKGMDTKLAGGLGALIGGIIGGAFGAIIGGFISGLLSSKSKEKQIEEQLISAFEQIKSSVESQAPKNIAEAIDAFFKELEKKAETMDNQMKHNIKLLEERMNENNKEIQKKNEKIQAALKETQNLIN